MNHPFHPIKHACITRRLEEISDYRLNPVWSLTPFSNKRQNLVSILNPLLNQVSTDKAGRARHENPQIKTPPQIPGPRRPNALPPWPEPLDS